MIGVLYRPLGFAVDILLYLVFMRRFFRKRPEATPQWAATLLLLALYAVYRLGFGYNEAASTVWHDIAIVMAEAVLCWMMNRNMFCLARRVSLAESLIFVITVHVGRKVFFHVLAPLFPPQQALAQLEVQLLVAALKVALVWLVTPRPEDVREDGVKELELFLLVFALYNCFLMDFLNDQFKPFGWSWNIDLVCYLTALLCAFVVRHTLADHCELQRITQINQLHQRQYEHLRQRQSSEQEIRRMCHDLKHQLMALRQDPENAEKMLSQVESTLEQHRRMTYADNPILDMLLREKAEAAQQEGIGIEVQMRIPPCAPLSDIDLCVIFGNALDNAVEAVRRLGDGAPRTVRVSCMSEPGFWMVRFQNPYQGTLALKDGLPRSTKADSANHGIGLRSIRTCVEQHGGTVQLAAEGQVFSLSVMVPSA